MWRNVLAHRLATVLDYARNPVRVRLYFIRAITSASEKTPFERMSAIMPKKPLSEKELLDGLEGEGTHADELADPDSPENWTTQPSKRF